MNLTPERLVTIAMTNRVPALAWTLVRVRCIRLMGWMMSHWGICGPTAKNLQPDLFHQKATSYQSRWPWLRIV